MEGSLCGSWGEAFCSLCAGSAFRGSDLGASHGRKARLLSRGSRHNQHLADGQLCVGYKTRHSSTCNDDVPSCAFVPDGRKH